MWFLIIVAVALGPSPRAGVAMTNVPMSGAASCAIAKEDLPKVAEFTNPATGERFTAALSGVCVRR